MNPVVALPLYRGCSFDSATVTIAAAPAVPRSLAAGVVMWALLGAAALALVPPRAAAADAALFGILKSQQFIQTNAAAPVALSPAGFAFNSFVLCSTNGAVTNATVDPPGTGTPVRTLVPEPGGLALRFEQRFDTQSALDTAYPNGGLTGNYLMTLQTVNDGVRSASLNFTLFGIPIGAPPVLQVTSLPAAQSIDHTLPYTLRWSGTGGQVLDLVQVLVLDAGSNTVWSSPAPLGAGALTGTSNHVVIPAYALPADAALTGHLGIARPGLPNTNSYPGVIGIAAQLRDTEFPVRTRPAPIAPGLEFVPPAVAPFRLRLTGEPGRVYRLQGSPDLRLWTDLVVTNSATGLVEFTDLESASLPRRAYRALVGQAP